MLSCCSTCPLRHPKMHVITKKSDRHQPTCRKFIRQTLSEEECAEFSYDVSHFRWRKSCAYHLIYFMHTGWDHTENGQSKTSTMVPICGNKLAGESARLFHKTFDFCFVKFSHSLIYRRVVDVFFLGSCTYVYVDILTIFVCVCCLCVCWYFANICLCGLYVCTNVYLTFCQYLFVWVVCVYECVVGILSIFVCVGWLCVCMCGCHFAIFVCVDCMS